MLLVAHYPQSVLKSCQERAQPFIYLISIKYIRYALVLLLSFLSLVKKCNVLTACPFLASSQLILSRARVPPVLIQHSTLGHTQPLKLLFVAHIRVSAKTAKH